jgi:hypothetical protein
VLKLDVPIRIEDFQNEVTTETLSVTGRSLNFTEFSLLHLEIFSLLSEVSLISEFEDIKIFHLGFLVFMILIHKDFVRRGYTSIVPIECMCMNKHFSCF